MFHISQSFTATSQDMANGFLAIRSITLQDPFLDFYEDTKGVKLVFYRKSYMTLTPKKYTVNV